MSAHLHLLVVHSEVHDAAPELEKQLALVAIAAILFDGVFHRLLGETVLQLKGGDGQAVDEQAQVKRPLGFIAAVAQLPGDRKTVLCIAFRCLGIAGRGRPVEEVQRNRTVLEAMAQHVDHPPFRDLPLQPGQELAPRRAVRTQVELPGGLRLCRRQKDVQLHQVHGVLTVVVMRVARDPARAAVARSG